MNSLQEISIILPNTDQILFEKIVKFLSSFGKRKDNKLYFTKSSPDFIPNISLESDNLENSEIRFKTENSISVMQVINSTGQEKQSQHEYSLIEFDDFIKRTKDLELGLVDHLGFDIPNFNGLHPEILSLREDLKDKCLYHLFPTGEPWDFILPGTSQEITSKEIDYSISRKPKFEIVSLDKTSTPIIQIDFSVKEKYENFSKLFPESLLVPELKNLWVYIKNPYNLDFCFVVNQYGGTDWNQFFKNHRLT